MRPMLRAHPLPTVASVAAATPTPNWVCRRPHIPASLTFATWVLPAVTAALLVATIVLAAATFEEKQRHEQPARQATEAVAHQER
jgi:hypothetical protein